MQRKKKVLVISTVGLIYDGITSVILSCLKAMNREDIIFYIASTIDCKSSIRKQLKELGCIVVDLPNRRSQTVQYFFSLSHYIKKERIDVVHAHGNSATLAIEMIASWLGGAKKRIAHSHNTRCDQIKADKILRPFFSLFYTDGLACGEDAGKWLYGSKSFTILKNGRDIERYSYKPETRRFIRKQLGIDKELAFGHVGGFVKQKNHEFIIDIFKEIRELEPTAKFYLIGDGPAQKDIKDKCKNLNVTFMGTIDNVYDYLNAMDGMILPSLFEGLPLVAVEWQLNGLPVLASETITKECALVSSIQFYSLNVSAKQWARKIIEMTKANERQESSVQAQINAKKLGFDIKNSADILRKIYLSD